MGAEMSFASTATTFAVSALSGAAVATAVGLVDFGRAQERLHVAEGRMSEIEHRFETLEMVGALETAFRDTAVVIEQEWSQLQGEMRASIAEASNAVNGARNVANSAEQLARDANQQLERLRDLSGIGDITEDPDFIAAVRRDLQIVPEFAVIASTIECSQLPGQWVEYISARNRAVFGAGDQLELGEVGGAEEVTLEAAHIPPHGHSVNFPHDVRPSFEQADHYRGWGAPGDNFIDQVPIIRGSIPRATSAYGGGEAHNNMPPYIALYWCTPVTGLDE